MMTHGWEGSMYNPDHMDYIFILGPSAVGKTTLANIIAKTLEVPFYTLSAVTSGVKEVREVIELLIADGWYPLKTKSTDHRHFKHPTKSGKVTVRGHDNEVLSQFLLNSIWKQAGWK